MFCHAHRWGWVPGEEEPVRRFRPVAEDGSVRVSQADRDAVVAQLSRHTGEGRLTLAEFEERVEEAYAASTRAELSEALRELPHDREHAPRRTVGARRGPWRPPAILVVAVVIVIAAATSWWAMWLLWPGLAWAGGGGCCGSRRMHQQRVASLGGHSDDVVHV
jgi:hypothetical protein